MAIPQRHYGKFRIRWTDETGRRRSQVFISKSDASFELQRRHIEVEEIKRGLRNRIQQKTFIELSNYWMAHNAKHKRSGKNDFGIIGRHLSPAFGHLYLSEITRSHIDSYKIRKLDLNPKTVGNHLALLRAMLNVAKDLNWIAQPPAIQLPRFRLQAHQFRYLQTREEMDRFLSCASTLGPKVHTLYATAVYTGCRAGEVAGLRWSDIDFSRRLITVQRSYDNNPTKSNQIRVVPILDPLLPILRKWRLLNPNPLVFPNRNGKVFGKSARVFQEIFQSVVREAGFKEVATSRGTNRALTFHDLRHTFASHWVMGEGDIFKLQRILGHQSMAMTQRYAHLSPAAFRDDWSRMGPAQCQNED